MNDERTITTRATAPSIQNHLDHRSSASDQTQPFASIPSCVIRIDQQEEDDNHHGLFNDDQEENLTLSDLQPKSICQHSLSIFDELAEQCQAVLETTNHLSMKNRSSPMSQPMCDRTDYEQRFQYSLQKLIIPSWFTPDCRSSSPSQVQEKNSPKIRSSSSTNAPVRSTARTPEIVHVRRACRSTYTVSPSPSLHSWHPNVMTHSMGLPSPSLSASRQRSKYEKGIERVSRSSHWYRPTPFTDTKPTNSTGELPSFQFQMIKTDQSQLDKQSPNTDTHLDEVKKMLINKAQNKISTGNSNEHGKESEEKSNISTSNDKWQENRIESPSMPNNEDLSMSYNKIELEEITDDENDEEKRLPSQENNSRSMSLSSLLEQTNSVLLEQLATDLVDSILAEVLAMECLQDEKNTGVRELSEDETGLRELDENDIHETDEFIVLATLPNPIDRDDQMEQQQNDDYAKNSLTSSSITPTTTNRGSLNRLYTFSRNTDENQVQRKTPSNQDISRSEELIITDRKSPTTDSLMIEPTTHQESVAEAETEAPLPIYRSHIQKRNINLGRYYDGMMRATLSQLPTHDLRCNLSLTPSPVLRIDETDMNNEAEGVNEETVRKGRLLLDSINQPTPETPPIIISQSSTPVRSILKNTRFASDEGTKSTPENYQVIVNEHKERVSPRKVITTLITEEYRRIQRQIIEEYNEDLPEQVPTSVSLKTSVSRQDRSPYESLSDCFSGYSSIQSDCFVPIKAPLVPNVSSIPCTTDEAYESDPTSTTSPTTSVSTGGTTTTTGSHVHPDLEHEFEYPSPPPPVPDRSLKPAHLRPNSAASTPTPTAVPPPTKPRTHKSQLVEGVEYASIERISTSPLTVIQHLIASQSNESTWSSARAMSSRHYCGTLPAGAESIQTSDERQTKVKTGRETRNSKTVSCIDPTSNHEEQSKFETRKPKRFSSPYFDEATNGLPVRLREQSNPNSPTPQIPVEEMRKIQIIPDHTNFERLSYYETSV